MSLKAGPYETPKAARTALAEAGYRPERPEGRRPLKWAHPIKPAKFAVRILKGGRAQIVPYPDLRRIDYQTTSDAERAGRGFRSSLTGTRPRTR